MTPRSQRFCPLGSRREGRSHSEVLAREEGTASPAHPRASLPPGSRAAVSGESQFLRFPNAGLRGAGWPLSTCSLCVFCTCSEAISRASEAHRKEQHPLVWDGGGVHENLSLPSCPLSNIFAKIKVKVYVTILFFAFVPTSL